MGVRRLAESTEVVSLTTLPIPLFPLQKTVRNFNVYWRSGSASTSPSPTLVLYGNNSYQGGELTNGDVWYGEAQSDCEYFDLSKSFAKTDQGTVDIVVDYIEVYCAPGGGAA